MKNLFRALVAALLVVSISFIMVGCVSKSKLVGTWVGEYTYEGNKFNVAIVLNSDGTFGKATVKNGMVSSSSAGTWEIKGGKLVLHNDEDKTMTEYKISLDGKKITNNGHDFKKKDA